MAPVPASVSFLAGCPLVLSEFGEGILFTSTRFVRRFVRRASFALRKFLRRGTCPFLTSPRTPLAFSLQTRKNRFSCSQNRIAPSADAVCCSTVAHTIIAPRSAASASSANTGASARPSLSVKRASSPPATATACSSPTKTATTCSAQVFFTFVGSSKRLAGTVIFLARRSFSPDILLILKRSLLCAFVRANSLMLFRAFAV